MRQGTEDGLDKLTNIQKENLILNQGKKSLNPVKMKLLLID